MDEWKTKIEQSVDFCHCNRLSRFINGKQRKRIGWVNYFTQVFWDYCNKCNNRIDGTISVV